MTPDHWRDIVAVLALCASGTALALTGHDQIAGTVFGGLLAYLIPHSRGAAGRAMIVVAGAAMGATLGGLV